MARVSPARGEEGPVTARQMGRDPASLESRNLVCGPGLLYNRFKSFKGQILNLDIMTLARTSSPLF